MQPRLLFFSSSLLQLSPATLNGWPPCNQFNGKGMTGGAVISWRWGTALQQLVAASDGGGHLTPPCSAGAGIHL